VPKHPATKARIGEVEESEASFNVHEMVRLGIEGATVEEFSFPE
jgi:hypothetical protein